MQRGSRELLRAEVRAEVRVLRVRVQPLAERRGGRGVVPLLEAQQAGVVLRQGALAIARRHLGKHGERHFRTLIVYVKRSDTF